MKCPMAPCRTGLGQLAFHFTSLLYSIYSTHGIITDNQPPSTISHQFVSPRTNYENFFTNGTLKQTTLTEVKKSAPFLRHVRSLDSTGSVPQFMKDVYQKYAHYSLLQPTYDVIRSFYPHRAGKPIGIFHNKNFNNRTKKI